MLFVWFFLNGIFFFFKFVCCYYFVVDFIDLFQGVLVVDFSVVSCGSILSEIELEVLYIIIGVFYLSNFSLEDVMRFLFVGVYLLLSVLCVLVIFIGYLFVLFIIEVVLEIEKKYVDDGEIKIILGI